MGSPAVAGGGGGRREGGGGGDADLSDLRLNFTTSHFHTVDGGRASNAFR